MPKNFEDVVDALSSLTIALKEGARVVSCPLMPLEIPGITTGAAHTAGDCLGTIMTLRVPKRGILYSSTLWDFDDEGLQIDMEIFSRSIAQIADDAAWEPTDASMLYLVDEVAFFAFDDHINSQTSKVRNIGTAYTASEGLFYIQSVARGASNIAAGAIPRVQLQILSGDPDFKES